MYVELGAGKGYLTLMLARATDAQRFVLTDVRTFQLKADRLLRRMRDRGDKRVELLRCRADLKDFCVPGAVRELSSAAMAASAVPAPNHVAADEAPNSVHDCEASMPSARLEVSNTDRQHEPAECEYVGLGKHLCGAATDFALRSLLQRAHSGSVAAGPDSSCRCSDAADAGSELAQASVCRKAQQRSHPAATFAGLCIAPCCHHACSWRAFVGKDTMRQLGFTARDFEMIAWMAGALQCSITALCKHAVLVRVLSVLMQSYVVWSCLVRHSCARRLPPLSCQYHDR